MAPALRQAPSDPDPGCVGEACGGFWSDYAINWPVAAMVLLCLLLLYWWGCNYIREWLEKHDLAKPKGWKHVCRGSNLQPTCLEHFNRCFCRNTIACGCHQRQVQYQIRMARPHRRLARAVSQRRQNGSRSPSDGF